MSHVPILVCGIIAKTKSVANRLAALVDCKASGRIGGVHTNLSVTGNRHAITRSSGIWKVEIQFGRRGVSGRKAGHMSVCTRGSIIGMLQASVVIAVFFQL